MSEYTFHNALEKANIADYVDLFTRAYGASEKLTHAYLQWLYEENPDGAAIGVDAFLGDELAAHYIAVPRRYLIDGHEANGLLSLNTATHPNHQRRGLFKQLAGATYERGSRLGFRFVIGVANAQSVHGFVNSLGFDNLGQVRLALFRRPVPPSDELPHLLKTAAWLRWRLSSPSGQYFTTTGKDGNIVLHARKGAVSFAIGSVSHQLLNEAQLDLPHRPIAGIASLTPVFPAQRGILLPLRLQPSPWHLILRPLNEEIDSMRMVQMEGLAMDTF